MSLYKVLGVAKTASKIEIKQAYRKLAMQFHPDKHTLSSVQTRAAAVDKFKQISGAYETLVDDRRRRAYDLQLSSASEARQHNTRMVTKLTRVRLVNMNDDRTARTAANIVGVATRQQAAAPPARPPGDFSSALA